MATIIVGKIAFIATAVYTDSTRPAVTDSGLRGSDSESVVAIIVGCALINLDNLDIDDTNLLGLSVYFCKYRFDKL